MFRGMRRFKQQLSQEDCLRILTEEKRAALAVIGDEGYPYALPVNYYYDSESGRIYFHGAKTGHKIDAIKACSKVCLTVWNQGIKREGHWEYDVESVVVFGRAHLVEDTAEIESYCRKLAEKYYPNQEEVEKEMQSNALSRVQVISIEIDHMTGKLVNEK